VPEQRSIQVQFDSGNSRTETLLGRDYFVVPTVAMVEGVRFGANQSTPELGLAAEFGENPIIWANRPLVLNHPTDADGFVSANTPAALEAFQFGVTMNPKLDGDKLKMEAWIDTARVEELGGDFVDTFTKIQNAQPVEVSVGFFSNVEPAKGQFNGQAYSGIWKNIKPDHLAVLASGIGACSIDSGCGIPRINQSNLLKGSAMPSTPAPAATPALQVECACEDDAKPVTQGGLRKLLTDTFKALTMTKEDKLLQAHIDGGGRKSNEDLVGQTIDPNLMSGDVRNMLSVALTKKFGTYAWLLGFTQNTAVFENLNPESTAFLTYQIGVNVSSTAVEFVGEPQEVLLQTKIVPQTTQEKDMPTESAPTPVVVDPPVIQQPAPAPAQPAKELTAQEYIDQAPPAVREVLRAQMKIYEDQKSSMVAAIRAHASNKFSEEYLKAQTLEVLDGMVSLLPGSFKGVASATEPRFQPNGATSETVPVPKINWSKPANEQAA